MARFDRFIRLLHDAGADRLTVAEGRPVVLSSGGDDRALTDDPASRDQIRSMLAELRPESDDPASEGRHEFTYRAPSGPVLVRALLSPGTVRLQMQPAEEEAEGTGPAGEAPPDTSPTAPADARAADAADPGAGEAAAEDAAGTAGGAAESPDGPAEGSPDEPPPDPTASTRSAGPGAAGDRPAIERLFRKMVDAGASDLHVSAGNPPLLRVDGEMARIEDEPAMSAEETRRMLLEIAPERNRKEFEETHDTDFGYEVRGLARFRCNLFLDREGPGGVFRQIPAEIMTAEELGLPDSLLGLCELKKGLVVVTGPTGSGKSTTLAALVDYINRNRRAHVITIEDPIEFVHENKQCLINQREVGVHTESFKVALRAALREDPDIVLVGEMRDLETVEIALETAETGHLVFGTLHTNTAASTVDRIIDQFPADQQNQIRTMLAESLEGVIAQTLCRRQEGGRVAAMEVLMVTSAVSNLIREGKTFQIPSLMQTGASAGMRTLNDALLERVQEGIVAPDEALRNAVDKPEFEQLLQRHGFSV